MTFRSRGACPGGHPFSEATPRGGSAERVTKGREPQPAAPARTRAGGAIRQRISGCPAPSGFRGVRVWLWLGWEVMHVRGGVSAVPAPQLPARRLRTSRAVTMATGAPAEMPPRPGESPAGAPGRCGPRCWHLSSLAVPPGSQRMREARGALGCEGAGGGALPDPAWEVSSPRPRGRAWAVRFSDSRGLLLGPRRVGQRGPPRVKGARAPLQWPAAPWLLEE